MGKPLKVLFDATPLLGNKSGVGIYTENLVRALAETYSADIQLTGFYFNFLGRKKINLDLNLPNVKFQPVKFLPGIFLPLLARKFGLQIPVESIVFGHYDVQLFTNFISLPTLRRTPQLLAVHDLGCFDVPDFVQEKNLAFLRRLLPRSVVRARKVITISEFTKSRIEEYWPKTKNNIVVTPIPPATQSAQKVALPERLRQLGIEKQKFILYLGTIEPRKNLVVFVEAFAALYSSAATNQTLVLAGGKGWKDQAILEAIERARSKSVPVILTGYISETEKAALYSNASIFVLPSHYEGFGMPALEAMSYQLPVVLSDIPVFHEVAGNAALYFDKDNLDDIKQKLGLLLNDKTLQTGLIARGQTNVKRFSWPSNAALVYAQMIELIRK